MAKEIAISFALTAALGSGFKGAFQSASASVRNVTAAIQSMERSPVGKIGAAMLAQREKIKGLAGSLKEAKGTLAALQSQAAGGGTAMLARQIQLAQTHVNNLSGAMQRQLGVWKNTAAQAATLGGSVGRLAADYDKLSQKMERARKVQGALAANRAQADALRAQRGDLNSRLTGAMATAATVGAPAKLSIDFEQSIANVGAVSNASDEDMKRLTETARQLGRDTMFSASQAAEGMKFLAMAGFNTEQTIAAMPGLLDLAAASATDLGTTSDIASDILTAFNMKASQMGEVGDILTRAFTNSNTDLKMLGETMKYVAPVAASMGVTLDQTAAYAGAMASAGIKGSQGGTVLRAAMLRLAAPPKASKDALAKLTGLEGAELDELHENLGAGAETLAQLGMSTKDAQGNMRPLVDILEELNARTSDMGNAEKAAIFKDVFGAEASAGMMNLAVQANKTIDDSGKQILDSSGNVTSALRKMLETTTNTEITAGKVAKKQMDTTHGSLLILSSAWQDAGLSVGNLFLPAIRMAAGCLSTVANVISGFINRFPALSKGVALAAGGIVALTAGAVGFGLILNFVRSGLNGFRGGLLRVVAAHVAATSSTVASTAATGGFGIASRIAGAGARFFAGGLRSILTATGVGAILVGLGFAINMLIDNWDGVVAAMTAAWHWLTDTWGRFGVFFSTLGASLVAIFTPIWDWICNAASVACDLVMGVWEGISGFFAAIWNDTGSVTAAVWDSICGIFTSAYDFAIGVWNNISAFFTAIGMGIYNTFAGVWDSVSGLALWAWEGISAIWNGALEFFNGIVEGISGIFTAFFDWLREKFAWVFKTIDAISSFIGSISDAVSGAAKAAFGDDSDNGAPSANAAQKEADRKKAAKVGVALSSMPPKPGMPGAAANGAAANAEANKTFFGKDFKPVAPPDAPSKPAKPGKAGKSGGSGGRRASGGGGGGGRASSGASAAAGAGSGPVTVVTMDGGNAVTTQYFAAGSAAPNAARAASSPVVQPASSRLSASPIVPYAPAMPGNKKPAAQAGQNGISIDLTQNFDLISQDAAAAKKVLEAIRPDMIALIRAALEKINSDKRRTLYAQ